MMDSADRATRIPHVNASHECIAPDHSGVRWLHALAAHSADAVALVDRAGDIQYVSPAVTRILGYAPHEITLAFLHDIQHPDDRDASHARHEALRTGPPGMTSTGEVRFRHRDGTYRWIEVVATNFVERDSVAGTMFNFRDITTRMEAETALRQSEARFRALVEKSADGIAMLDATGIIRYVSPVTPQLFGFHLDDVVGKSCLDYLPPEDHENTWRNLGTVAATPGASVALECRIMHQNSTWMWARVTITNYLADPDIGALVVNYHDLTDRKRAEDAQRRERGYLQALHEVTLGIVDRLEVNDLLHALIARAGELLGTDHGFINLVSERGDEMQYIVGHGLFDITGLPPTHRGEGLSGIVWQTGQPLTIADYTGWAHHRPGPHLAQMHAAVGVPLLSGDVVTGMLGLAYTEPGRTFDAADIEILSQFARLASLALENARLYGTMQASEVRYRTMIDTAQEGVWLFDARGVVTFANEKMAQLLGCPRAEIEGTSFTAFMDAETGARVTAKSIDRQRDTLGQHECRFLRPDGTSLWAIVASSPLRDDRGAITDWLCMVTDITERKQAEDALRHHATHDALTGLPNRTLLFTRLTAAIARRETDSAARFALLFLDLDRFKHVNDSLGHTQGDHLLVAIVERVRAILPPASLLARWGGDEFAILMEGITDVRDAIQLTERLHATLAVPFAVDGTDVYMSASIGIAPSSRNYTAPEEVLRDADTAMYHAKAHGSGQVLFDTTMHTQAVARLQLESDLRQALERGEFVAHYQPIMSLVDGTVTGVEALARWQHPQRGLIPPAAFIPIAEETGMIVALNRWMLRTACIQMRQWVREFPALASLSVNVNISARDLARPDFVADTLAALTETGFSPQHLNIEITEGALVEHADTAATLLGQLQAAGIHIHLDDFGTGYSSLGYLRRFAVNALKIDQSFLRAEGGETDMAIVRAVVALAHSLGIRVIAEGIETPAQVAWLRQLACGEGQGYVFARPLDADDAARFLIAHTPPARYADAGIGEYIV